MKRVKVNEVYNEWKSGKGFFHFLYYYFSNASPVIECPFIPDGATAELLDMKYHGGHSGRKITSIFVDTYLDDFDGMQDAYFVRFAEIFWKLNSENLLREWSIMQSQYNPLNNYEMTESGTDTRGGTQTYNATNSSTTQNTGTDTTRQNTDMTTETGANDSSIVTHSINGFNSGGTGVNADSTKTTDKTQTTGTAQDNYSEIEHGLTVETSGGTDSTITDDFTNSHSLTRSGNIGVTTSVDMLSQHGDFWDKWNFYNILFATVDKLLTIPIY